MPDIAVADTDSGDTFNAICTAIPNLRSESSPCQGTGTDDRAPQAGNDSTNKLGIRPLRGTCGCPGVCVGSGFCDRGGADGLRRYDGFGGIDRFGSI